MKDVPDGTTPTKFIRRYLLRMTQQQLAAALDRTQPTIHKREKRGAFTPDEQIAVRNLVRDHGLPWSDSWFFEVPATVPEGLAGAESKAAV